MYTSITAAEAANPLHIERRYLDANLATYYYHSKSSSSSFTTAKGHRIQDEMEGYAKTFNLSFSFGEAPQSYYLNRYPMIHDKSLIKLYVDEVFNTVLGNKSEKVTGGNGHSVQPAFLFNTGGARFDIFKGPFTRDDQFTVIPFENGLWNIAIPLDYDLVLAVVEWLNSLTGEPEMLLSAMRPEAATSIVHGTTIKPAAWLGGEAVTIDSDWLRQGQQILVDSMEVTRHRNEEATRAAAAVAKLNEASDDASVESVKFAHLPAANVAAEKEAGKVRESVNKRKEKPTFGYVTHDSCSGHGDDIRHRPLPAFAIPEFVLSSPLGKPLPLRTKEAGAERSVPVHLVFYVS